MVTALRSGLFYVGLGAITPVFSILVIAFWPLPYGVREDTARIWCRLVLAWLRVTCGITHRVIGSEHLTPSTAVILAKHQSAWDTIAFRTIFPARLSWVIKSSLFRIPFYGWSLRALEEIGIDRGSGREALRQVEERGQAHIEAGRWVVVFPEGKRTRPGEVGRYAQGGAKLAVRAGVPVVPVALDSGHCWPTDDWRKYPGCITVVIGPPIEADGRGAAQLSRTARDWIEGQCAELERDRSPRAAAA
jgi:1-acyl-sn-glycerol-3-phosphate acyltransferase